MFGYRTPYLRLLLEGGESAHVWLILCWVFDRIQIADLGKSRWILDDLVCRDY
jgi:hypothetical protein